MTKKTYIKIENKGEIEPGAFSLLGATSKRGDNSKIGYFGSGLKYALAVLLRHNVEFHVFSGTRKVNIEVRKSSFRNTEFDVIHIDGMPTSLTTEMGVDWHLWYAVREIYCNSLDEPDANISVSQQKTGKKGTTRFYIEMSQLSEVFKDWKRFFSDKRNDVVSVVPGKARVYERYIRPNVFLSEKASSDGPTPPEEASIIYRKGVNVGEIPGKCLYDYDLNSIDITESRTIASTFSLRWDLAHDVWAETASIEMIKNLFDNGEETFEMSLPWEYANDFNQNWLTVIGNRVIVPKEMSGYFLDGVVAVDKMIILPASLCKALKQYFSSAVRIRGFSDEFGEKDILNMTEKQTQMLTFVLDFFKKAGYNVDFKTSICDFHDDCTLGEAVRDTILLSPKAFDGGLKFLASTVIEESMHLKTGYGDKTLGLQSYLFNFIVSLMEEKTGLML